LETGSPRYKSHLLFLLDQQTEPGVLSFTLRRAVNFVVKYTTLWSSP